MAINWSSVPIEFHYLQNEVVARYDDDIGVRKFDESLGRHVDLAERLSEDELNELATIYENIQKREDNLRIVDWSSANQQGPKRETGRTFFCFLFLLRRLGVMGIEPFSHSLILAERPPLPLDWTSLPQEIAFLQGAVECYPGAWNESWIMDWLDSATEADLLKLEDLSRTMQPKRRLIREWFRKHAGSREEMHVSGLILLFDHAGIEYGEPAE